MDLFGSFAQLLREVEALDIPYPDVHREFVQDVEIHAKSEVVPERRVGVTAKLLPNSIVIFVAFNIIPDTPNLQDMQGIASLGLIPALSGLGLLAFYLLTRRMDN